MYQKICFVIGEVRATDLETQQKAESLHTFFNSYSLLFKYVQFSYRLCSLVI